MAEQTFKSPGFFEQEIDLSERQSSPSGVPAGIVGTADKGPAFVPVTVGSWFDFEARFGGLNPNRFGPYAVREWLKNRNSLTYMRVLGAGSNDTATEIGNTRDTGTVANAGFKVSGSLFAAGVWLGANEGPGVGDMRTPGVVQFLCAKHHISASEGVGFPIFTDNDSFDERASGADDIVNLVRAVLLTPTGSRFMIMDGLGAGAGGEDIADSPSLGLDDFATLEYTTGKQNLGIGTFRLILSSTAGSAFAADDGIGGVRIMTASLNPDEQNYISNILNTDPTKFQEEQHLLFADFAVEQDIAQVCEQSEASNAVAILSGSGQIPASQVLKNVVYRNLFGRFDTRYTTPKSSKVISQPYGNKEYNLFHFESISDGAYGNDKVKISIANLKASTDPANQFGSFEVQVRRFDDTDVATQIIERYPDCNLNPNDDRYVARIVGDKKVRFDFDQELEEERRLIVTGKYPNKSVHIRIVMDGSIERGEVPETALPFGFRGVTTMKTTDTLTDTGDALTDVNGDNVGRLIVTTPSGIETPGRNRMAGYSSTAFAAGKGITALTGSIIPPLPFRFKTTRGDVASSAAWVGESGINERIDARYYWGVKFTRAPVSGSVSDPILNTNVGAQPNPLVKAYTQFAGIEKIDTLVTGSGADYFNNNKFTMARVALYNAIDGSGEMANLTGSAKEHMLNAAYIRNGSPDSSNYSIQDPVQGSSMQRITFATMVQSSSIKFNRFSDYAKFTFPLYGGFDGVNILDFDNYYLNDKASSSDAFSSATREVIGKASTDYTSFGGLASNVAGTGKDNNIVFSYKAASKAMLDELVVNTNILAIPGIRDKFVTDYAGDRTKDYAMAIYIMDAAHYDEDGVRIFDGRPDVDQTADEFISRAMDNNYVATYFPDVIIEDPFNNRRVEVPSSVAALGAYGFNDKVGYPWFAPAGFNRAALDFVKNLDVRLTAGNRDKLYEANINPIAVFPNSGGKSTFVIFGQKTLQLAKSALDRVNVRRMLLEVKRQVVNVATRIIFEPNTPSTRQRFVAEVTPLLGLIQSQAGIEAFKVVCDESNNTNEDVEGNKLNGRIIVVPTRAVEFISIDFIVTNSGVSFE